MALEPAREVEFEQDHEDLGWMQLGVTDQFIDADRRWTQRLDNDVRDRNPRSAELPKNLAVR